MEWASNVDLQSVQGAKGLIPKTVSPRQNVQGAKSLIPQHTPHGRVCEVGMAYPDFLYNCAAPAVKGKAPTYLPTPQLGFSPQQQRLGRGGGVVGVGVMFTVKHFRLLKIRLYILTTFAINKYF